ncbi:purine-binding chemotaxis protein CheW [Clostridium amylolyticum]|uniref:Purine-binding chemotaxis protein CheW n=1 Tax=Clostridium amylolyticum TaxID=1121298 RepID=A0A1M6CC32_9CLOT|nr:chemotaxis protein CheW [Clostridium amylolyticum]SHI58559.1 purine-binding chemotaxis protein CheW [Clostridium amylolyticum]
MQAVIFKINDEQFAVETSKVQGINDIINMTKVPKANSYIKGLINLRGNIISVLDINMLLNMESCEKQQNNIIILNIRDEQVGITVDQVDEVLDIDESIIEQIREENANSYIKGIINFKDKIATLIDLDKLIVN